MRIRTSIIAAGAAAIVSTTGALAMPALGTFATKAISSTKTAVTITYRT